MINNNPKSNTIKKEDILFYTTSGKQIYENHSFKMYVYPGSWASFKVLKIEKDDVFISDHIQPIKSDIFSKLIEEGERIKKEGKDHLYHRLEYYLSNHGNEKNAKDNRKKIKKISN